MVRRVGVRLCPHSSSSRWVSALIPGLTNVPPGSRFLSAQVVKTLTMTESIISIQSSASRSEQGSMSSSTRPMV